MKKMLNVSFAYAIAALCGGVFYREFTRWNSFEGRTSLGFVHTHLFLLGMIVFLLVALFSAQLPLQSQPGFRCFLVTYNLGVVLTTALLVVRGIAQVLALPLSRGASAAISGIAGIGHLLVAIGLVLLFLSLKKVAKN